MVVLDRKDSHIDVSMKTADPDGKDLELRKHLKCLFGNHRFQSHLKMFASPFIITT